MPWTVEDVEKHKKGLSPTQKRQWVHVANGALQRCMANGGNEETCAASAIRQANGVAGNASFVQVNLRTEETYHVTEQMLEGRKHLVVPVVMMTEGVHNGSYGPLLHTIAELGRWPESWNGIPVTIDHPVLEGMHVSANSPEILDTRTVGRIFNTHVDGAKLRAEAWLDEERLRQISPVTLAQVNACELIEVSVGVFNDTEDTPGVWNDEEYSAIARNHRPDHLALLPGGVGACSVDDGCGVRVNQKGGDNMPNTNAMETALEATRQELGMTAAEFYAVPRNPPISSKLPIYDEAHVRNAMARFNQTQGLSDEEKASARRKIISRALHYNIETEGFDKAEVNSLEEASLLKAEGLVHHTIIDNTSGGMVERVDALRAKIDSMDSESVIHFLREAYDDSVIYEARMRVGGTHFFKQDYQVNNGIVELVGNPVEVVRKVEYVSVNKGRFVRTTPVKSEVQNMENVNCPKCVEKVNSLIANSNGKFKEEHREWLNTLSEAQLDLLAPTVVEKPVEVNKLTPDQEADLAYAARQRKERRTALVQEIQANSSKEIWPDAELNALSEAQLEKLYKTVTKEDAPTSFAVVPASIEVNANDEEALALPSFEVKSKN